MISTSRGLSAVRPGDELESETSAFRRVGRRSAAPVLTLPVDQQPAAARSGDDDTDSTTTPSAFAV
jgi:hypothetical protein